MLVHSIFESISGEAGFFPQGTWCTFIRLQNCNLSCRWCDTPQAKESSFLTAKRMDVEKIVEKCYSEHVLITGGEPLARDQEELCQLLESLHAKKVQIQIETNGSLSLPSCRPPAKWVMDRKCPSSGMHSRMLPRWKIKQYDRHEVILKYVIKDRRDLEWMIRDVSALFNSFSSFIVSPLDADGRKVHWIASSLRSNIPHLLDKVIFSVQMHKILKMA